MDIPKWLCRPYVWDRGGNILMQLPGNNNQNLNILYNHIHINEIIIIIIIINSQNLVTTRNISLLFFISFDE